jgi:hypothetical protein
METLYRENFLQKWWRLARHQPPKHSRESDWVPAKVACEPLGRGMTEANTMHDLPPYEHRVSNFLYLTLRRRILPKP